jgi:ABC-type transporter Mla subunit MlaD
MLPFERQYGMGELAHELVERLKPILDNVQVTTKSLNGSDGLVNHVKGVAIKFEKAGQDMSSLMQKTQSVVAEENLKLGTALDKSNAAMDKAGALLDSFNDVAKDVRKVTTSSAEKIPSMLRDSNEAAEDARNIINSAKDSWPIKNMMEAEEAKILPMDSYGAENANPK